MPNLTKIWLSKKLENLDNNKLNSIDSFEKCRFPNLNVVWLSNYLLMKADNLITELKYQYVFWPELSEFYVRILV